MGLFSSVKQRHAEELAEQAYHEKAATELANVISTRESMQRPFQ